MDTQGVTAGSTVAQTAQKASIETAPATIPEKTDLPYLSKLELLGADHPLTKFLGGFWSQHVDVEA